MSKITHFANEYEFLSNFHQSTMKIDGKTYPTNEHYFQACKADNEEEHEKIRLSGDPMKAKKLGRKCKMRKDWESVKIDVMRKGLQKKFANPVLKEKLLATGDDELVEGNWWRDQFWGVCDGKGENWLGKLLMETREQIREGK